MRTFFAIKPPIPALEAMAREAAHLRGKITTGVKWTPASQIHLTIKFLGDFSPAHVHPLQEKLVSDWGQIGPIDLAATSIGVFPLKGDPRVIWYGIQTNPTLAFLARVIEDTCADFGYAREKRPFNPHFTIGRVMRNAGKDEMRSVRQALHTLPDINQHPITIESLYFIQSNLTPAGPQYRDLFTIQL